MPESRRESESTRASTAQDCARRVMDTVPGVMRLIRCEVRREAGEVLSVPQYRVLAFLSRNHAASLSEVAGWIGVAGATASAMVDRLVRRGLVARRGDPEERRRVRLRVTRAGAALVRRARARTRGRLAARLAALPAADRLALARGLDLLRLAFQAPPEPRP
jgi:DNA-binding MarR family transcriptional regulator